MSSVTLKLAQECAEAARQAQDQRDQFIRQASADGASLREIADAVGLSHMTVKRICAAR